MLRSNNVNVLQLLQAAQKKLLQRDQCSSFSQHGMHSLLCCCLILSAVDMSRFASCPFLFCWCHGNKNCRSSNPL